MKVYLIIAIYEEDMFTYEEVLCTTLDESKAFEIRDEYKNGKGLKAEDIATLKNIVVRAYNLV